MFGTRSTLIVAALTFLGFTAPQPAHCQQNCASASFHNIPLFGGEILETTSTFHTNLSFTIDAEQNHYAKNVTRLSVCEVLIKYTHPGYNDIINIVVWLPSMDAWTGRFLAAGGGGWATGSTNATLAWAASEGFAVVTTDGGHSRTANTEDWAMTGPGNVNWILLQDFSSITLNDAAILGKEVTEAYYGQKPSYSYWNGCSTGGRQGHMMAQRYPEQFDGILATASAFNWGEMLMQEFWPQAVMNDIGEYPSPCELEAVKLAAIEACDSLDGLADDIINLPGQCQFDPTEAVGKSYLCSSTQTNTIITKLAATVAKATWEGARGENEKFLWYGLNPGAPFSADANTNCTSGTCVGVPLGFPAQWIQLFLVGDPEFDVSTVNRTVFEYLFHQSVNRYDSIIGTSDADLSYFRKAGGKLLTWHGLADSLIAANGTVEYVRRVHQLDPDAADYYRFFEAPGVDHCDGGNGWYPGTALNSLIRWVEDGVAPETLEAKTVGLEVQRTANLCLWPKSMVYVDGDPNEAESFTCQ